MIRTILLALGSTATLAACVPITRDGLRERRPTLQTTSTRSVAEISGCIGDAWQKLEGNIAATPRSNGATITWGNLALVDLQAGPGATQVTMYGPYSIRGGMNQRRVNEVRSCL